MYNNIVTWYYDLVDPNRLDLDCPNIWVITEMALILSYICIALSLLGGYCLEWLVKFL